MEGWGCSMCTLSRGRHSLSLTAVLSIHARATLVVGYRSTAADGCQYRGISMFQRTQSGDKGDEAARSAVSGPPQQARDGVTKRMLRRHRIPCPCHDICGTWGMRWIGASIAQQRPPAAKRQAYDAPGFQATLRATQIEVDESATAHGRLPSTVDERHFCAPTVTPSH
jgi:hypothetical protein